MRLRFIVAALALIVATLGLTALLNRTTNEEDTRPRIAASIFPVHSIVNEIAGDTLQVVQLLPSGANPHTFEPTPDTVALLEGVPVIYTIGLGVDDWAKSLTTATMAAVPLTQNIALRTADDGTVDPHYWLSIPNAKTMAQYVAEDLVRRYPEHASTFQANLGTFLGELNDAENEMRNILSGVENHNIVTMHDAWYYFAQQYGFTVVGTFEPTSGREPTPDDIANLAQTVATHDINAIYIDAGESEEAMEAFAADNNLALVALDAEGTSGTYTSYISLMLGNAQRISENQ